jgi:hypothetical protein
MAFEDLCPEHVRVRVVKSFAFLIHNIVLRLIAFDVCRGDEQPKGAVQLDHLIVMS